VCLGPGCRDNPTDGPGRLSGWSSPGSITRPGPRPAGRRYPAG